MGAVFDLRPWRFFSSLKLINKSPLLAFDDLIQRHGPIIRISMFGHHTVLLGGKEEEDQRRGTESFDGYYFLIRNVLWSLIQIVF